MKDELKKILRSYAKEAPLYFDLDWKAWEIIERVWLLTSEDFNILDINPVFADTFNREAHSESLMKLYKRSGFYGIEL